MICKIFFLKYTAYINNLFYVNFLFSNNLTNFITLVHCFINLFTFFDVYFEMNRIKNDANTHCI